jgi:ectoine hydroxylase-related dioxygenase (phytanoyl-CoA dioxygenase family)
MSLMQKVRELGRARPAAPFKQAAKRAIDLVDGTTFRARPLPAPEGPIAEFYQKYGYAIFRGVLPVEKIDALRATVETEVIASDQAFLRHKSVKRERNIFFAGTRLPNDGLLDAHAQPETPSTATAIESLLLTDRVADLLTSIDGANNYTIHQTIVFFIPPGTGLHLDGWSLDTEPRGLGHTIWIPLEAVTLSNGPLAIVPWPRGKIVTASELGVDEPSEPADDPRRPYETYHTALNEYLRHQAPDCVVPQLEAGDLVVFASSTPHGTLPFATPSRWAMQVIVRPSNLRWGSWPQFQAGMAHSPNGPWRGLKTVGERWRIVTIAS